MIDPIGFAPWVSEEARATFAAALATPPAPPGDLVAVRAYYEDFNRRHLAVALDHYPTTIVRDVIAGVAVDVVTPTGAAVDQRTLLCLHGGAFMWGRGPGALLEAVPVAATAGVRVIAIEYALAPERVFPAAVEDVLAVYTAVCARQPAGTVGIYGCSAGAILTAQATAQMIASDIAVPGGIAMLCGAGLDMLGDSAVSAATLTGQRKKTDAGELTRLPYFASADPGDPLVFPGEHADVLARFPPSLLVTGSRDFAASSVTVMHRRLLDAGARSSLLYLDGMWHAHHMATTMPESRETFAALARFFGETLT